MKITKLIKEQATSKIGELDVVYNYEYEDGNAPEMIHGRLTKEGQDTAIDAYFYKSNNNLQVTVHYINPDFDFSSLEKVFKDIKKIAKV